MLWWLTVSVGLASGGPCETIGMSDVLAVTPPAVIVLGERHGTQPDLRRATRIVRALANRAPTTVALEAVHAERQPILDQYVSGDLPYDLMQQELDWDRLWGFPYRPYAPLVTAIDLGARTLAVGLPLERAPESAEFPVPGGYTSVMRDAMGENAMPLSMQSGFVRAMAWRDFRIAQQSLQGWDQQGYLVILTGREHVVGGKGVAWQAGLMTRTPVHAFVLAWATDPPCFAGDKLWRPGPFEPTE